MNKLSLLRSLALHTLLAVLLSLLVTLPLAPPQEVPIEISQILKAAPARPLTKIATARQNIERPIIAKDPVAAEQSNTANPSLASQVSAVDGSDNGESLAEEYEVSSLPVPLNEVRVPFPEGAKARHAQGAVVFLITVSSSGLVVKATPVGQADPELSQAAQNALLRFRFKPAILRDKPVAIQIRYTYRFVLQ